MCDILDELEDIAVNTQQMIAEETRIVGPWENAEPVPVTKEELLDMVKDLTGFAKSVVDQLYYFNSKVEKVEIGDKQVLLILRDAEVIIDLFNNRREDFIKSNQYKSKDEYIAMILEAIGTGGFEYYSLNEALLAIHALRTTNLNNSIVLNKNDFEPIIKRENGTIILKEGAIVANCITIIKEIGWKFIMNLLFHGKHNWASSQYYSASIQKLKSSLLEYHVICYECLANIREEKGKEKTYVIETSDNGVIEIDKLDDKKQIAIFACFNENNPNARMWVNNTSIKFMGMFKVDKARSTQENHLVFKLDDPQISIP